MASQVHFLVVEDDAVIRRAIGRAAHGLMEARFAESGAGALDALSGPRLPRFVLLDHGLPDIDGLEVLRRLRADDRLAGLPILMFSSLQDPARIQETMDAGADAWIPKPDDPARLREAVRAACVEWGGAGLKTPVEMTVRPAAASESAASSATAAASAGQAAAGSCRLLWRGHVVATARSCEGLARVTDAVEEAAPAGGVVRRSPGRTRYPAVLLHDLTVNDAAFEAWAAHGEPARRDLALQVCDARGEPVRSFLLSGCWASGYEASVDAAAAPHVRLLRLETDGWRLSPP